ncbi:MAG: outer membrane lipoprotein-sorting protein [Bacteriovoracaceae bacterium]|nr:outer membrane lipoprotein-sorting protein [Bacteriovoracaceae bacterium]
MKKLLITAIMLLISINLYAKDSINDIMKKAHLAAYYMGKDGVAQMVMKVYAKDSKKPIKKLFYMLRLNNEEGGRQMFYTYFQKPSDISRTTFLVHKFIDQDDFRRLYIPASDKVLAIAGSRKQDPFMGSDFIYEDVSGRHFTKDNHKLLGEETLDGVQCFVTESTPKVKEDKTYKIKAWIDKKTYIPMKVVYFNHDKVEYRIYESQKIQTIGNYPTIMKRVMTSPLDGTKTVMMVNPEKVKYDVGLTESVFTERSLKNPPMKYLK